MPQRTIVLNFMSKEIFLGFEIYVNDITQYVFLIVASFIGIYNLKIIYIFACDSDV